MPQRALIAELDGHFATLTLEECTARYAKADCCFAPVQDLGQAVKSNYMRARGLVRRHPQTNIYEAAYPVCVDGVRPTLRQPLQDEAAAPDTPR